MTVAAGALAYLVPDAEKASAAEVDPTEAFGPDTLKSGDTGTYVNNLQTELAGTWAGEGNGNSGGPYGFYHGEISEEFDSATKDAVVAFQQFHGLEDDGRVGPATKRELVIRHSWDPSKSPDSLTDYGSKTLALGSDGIYVSNLQAALNEVGYTVDLDGHFGPDLEKNTKAFQKTYGLKVDGRFGPAAKDTLVAIVQGLDEG
jgi:peptidoglycan hydrolase-like protein with peptidoglycan-binding domain